MAQAASYFQVRESLWPDPQRNLLAFARTRHAEIYAAVVVGFVGRIEIEVAERNLLRPLRREYPQRLAHDRVVLHFLFVLVAEDQDGFRTCGRGLGSARRRRARIGILIPLPTSLVVRARIIRRASVLLVGIRVRIVVPPPVRIDSAAKIGIAVSPPPAAVSIAVVAESTSPDAHSHTRMVAASERARCA